MIGSGRPTTGRPKRGSHREGRDHKLCIRISDKDLKKLETICSTYYISKSDLLIGLINEEYKEVLKMNGN